MLGWDSLFPRCHSQIFIMDVGPASFASLSLLPVWIDEVSLILSDSHSTRFLTVLSDGCLIV